MVEIYHGMANTENKEIKNQQRFISMSFVWKHPKYYKKINKENDLTNQSNDDKENHNEKIQNKNNSISTRTKRSPTIRLRTKPTTT